MLYSRTKYKKVAKAREDKAKAEAKAAFDEHRAKQQAELAASQKPADETPPAGEPQISDEQIVAKCDELKKELWKDLSKKDKALVKSLTA